MIQRDTILHLKTDNKDLYDYTLATLAEDWQTIESTEDLYTNDTIHINEDTTPTLLTQTEYEKRYLAVGEKIKYIKFKLR
jgi:tRNA (guanine-N7-)-methyltransferase